MNGKQRQTYGARTYGVLTNNNHATTAEWFVQHFCAASTCNYAKQRVLLRDVTRVRSCGPAQQHWCSRATDAQDSALHMGGCRGALFGAPAGGLPGFVDARGSPIVRAACVLCAYTVMI